MKQYPSNMSVTNCERSKYLETHNEMPFQEPYLTPSMNKGYYYYNPEIFKGNLGEHFWTVPPPCAGCSNPNWLSTDPRLMSNTRGNESITLDIPPFTGDQIKQNEIAYAPVLNGYGQNYRSYSDINAGDILYYNDISQQDPYFNPNFVTSASTNPYLYRDPMGSIRPRYDRIPVHNNPNVGQTRANYQGGLSFIEDTMNHRQDIMAHQMVPRIEQRWEPRWQVPIPQQQL